MKKKAKTFKRICLIYFNLILCKDRYDFRKAKKIKPNKKYTTLTKQITIEKKHVIIGKINDNSINNKYKTYICIGNV